MGILIKEAGVLDTIQDLGRYGYRKLGINPSGVMDNNALRLINIILGNAENKPALEMHFPACQIVFDRPVVFALGGADFDAVLDKSPIQNWKTYQAREGSILKFRTKISGNRCYFAIENGFEIEEWLGSASTNLAASIGGIEGRKLKKGDQIRSYKTPAGDKRSVGFEIATSLRPVSKTIQMIRVTKGIEYRDLTALSEQRFYQDAYEITNNSDRMGYRLDGNSLHLLSRSELLSSAVGFGTIQLPPNGKPLVLMADHQTTGGYPKIAHVIKSDLHLIGQMGPGDKILFELVSLDEAEKIDEQFERDLAYLRMGVKFKQNDANDRS